MGFRSVRALLSVSVASVTLAFIVGCATQASDTLSGGGGDAASSGGSGGHAGSSGNGGSVAAAGTSTVVAGQGGGLGTAGAGGTSTAGTGGAAGGAAAGSAGVGGTNAGGAGGVGHGGTAGSSGTSGAGGSGGAAAGASGGGAGGASGSGTGGGGASGGGAGGAAGGGAGGAAGAGGGTGGSAGTGGNGGIVGKTFTLNHFVIGSSNASATVTVTWNATHLEFLFDVQDATPEDDSAVNWQDDAGEIYLNLNNDNTTTFESDDCEIVIPRLTGTVDGVGSASYGAIGVVRSSVGATGYTLDVTIPWTALPISTPPHGQTIGLNLAVDDDTNGGDRDAQLMLSGTDQAYNNPSTWASLVLN